MRRGQTLVVVLSLVVLGACGSTAERPTAEAAAAQAIQQGASWRERWQPGGVQIHGTRVVPQGVVVLYSKPRDQGQEQGPRLNFGYVLTQQTPAGWIATAASFGGGTVAPNDLVAYSRAPLPGGDTIVYGEAVLPEVAAIEVSLPEGAILQDQLTGEMFAVLIPGNRPICTVRVLDAAGHIIQTMNETDAVIPSSPETQHAPNQAPSCPRTGP